MLNIPIIQSQRPVKWLFYLRLLQGHFLQGHFLQFTLDSKSFFAGVLGACLTVTSGGMEVVLVVMLMSVPWWRWRIGADPCCQTTTMNHASLFISSIFFYIFQIWAKSYARVCVNLCVNMCGRDCGGWRWLWVNVINSRWPDLMGCISV